MSYRGLTWDHPRGYNALAAASKSGGPVQWDVQPLEGFESASIGKLCAEYDLVVLDHPHLGEALALGCLTPLDEVFTAQELTGIANGAIGPSYTSYAMEGRQWALPLDAATQVMALRPDLTEARPTSWDDVDKLSQSGSVALSLAGPHAFLSFLSICASLNPDLDMRDGGWPSDHVAEQAYEILVPLAARTPKHSKSLNPIGLLDYMTRENDISMVPLIYGYVNYTRAARPIAFHDAPTHDSPTQGARPGSILGGTGIAISKGTNVDAKLRAHLLWLMSAGTQNDFIPGHDGQPGLRSAWLNSKVNSDWGNFYLNTKSTLEDAAIRPRHDGYIAYQSQASALLRHAFDTGTPAPKVVRHLRAEFEESKLQRSTK